MKLQKPPKACRRAVGLVVCIIWALCISLMGFVISLESNTTFPRCSSLDDPLLTRDNENSHLLPDGVVNKNPRIIDITLYGSLHEYAYYYTIIDIGIPAQKQAVVVDTGSPNLILASSICSHCGNHTKPPLNPTRSQTLCYVDGNSSFCGQIGGRPCDHRKCCFDQSYAEESAVAGRYVSDYFSFAGETKLGPIYRLRNIGLVTKEKGPVYEQKANGVMGLGILPPISEQSSPSDIPIGNSEDFFQNESPSIPDTGDIDRSPAIFKNERDVANGGQSYTDICFDKPDYTQTGSFITSYLDWHFSVDKHVFSICFSDQGGLLTLGGYHKQMLLNTDNNSHIPGNKEEKPPVIWIPLLKEDGYVIKLEAMYFSGIRMVFNNSSFTVDSGSTYSLLEESIYGEIVSFYGCLCNLIHQQEQHQFYRRHHTFPRNFFSKREKRLQNLMATVSRDGVKWCNDQRDDRSNETDKTEDQQGDPASPILVGDVGKFPGEGEESSHSLPKQREDAVKSLHRRLNGKTTCKIGSKTGYLCFSEISGMPAIKLYMKGRGTVRWRPKSYFIRRTKRFIRSSTMKKEWWCLGLGNGLKENVLGATFFKNNLVVFDLWQSRLGFSMAQCPQH